MWTTGRTLGVSISLCILCFLLQRPGVVRCMGHRSLLWHLLGLCDVWDTGDDLGTPASPGAVRCMEHRGLLGDPGVPEPVLGSGLLGSAGNWRRVNAEAFRKAAACCGWSWWSSFPWGGLGRQRLAAAGPGGSLGRCSCLSGLEPTIFSWLTRAIPIYLSPKREISSRAFTLQH